jgi:mannose/fructose/sorbose-specific phosphotransferase system IIA component
MLRGIIIGHGDFAKAMLKTAEQIVGEQSEVAVISNQGLSCDSIVDTINRAIGRDDVDRTIIFLDLPGGSCTISCYGLLREKKDLHIISGINLPMLIEFFMLRDKYSADELVTILIEKGKANIIQLRCKNG